MKCERCDKEAATIPVALTDGSQRTELCEACVEIVIRDNTAFQVVKESTHHG